MSDMFLDRSDVNTEYPKIILSVSTPRSRLYPGMQAAAATIYTRLALATSLLVLTATRSSGKIFHSMIHETSFQNVAIEANISHYSTKKGSLCVTYSIFEDLGATTYSPFLGCGDRGAKNFQLVRTWTGSPVVRETDSSMPNPTAVSGDSQPRVTDDVQPTETGQSGDAGSAGPTSDNGGPNLRLNSCLLICIYLVVTGALMG